MKIKKEDLGLYFALALMGGGVGIFLGSFFTSRRTKVIQKEVDETVKAINQIGKSVKEDISLDEMEDPTSKKEFEKKLAELIERYSPNKLQIQMAQSGVITLENLEYALAGEYAFEEDDKPDLEDLVDLEEEDTSKLDDMIGILEDGVYVVNSRFELLELPPEDKDPKRLRVIYVANSGTPYVMTRRGDKIPEDPENIVGNDVWHLIKIALESGNYSEIYANDLETTRYYRFEIADDEDSASEESGRSS